MPQNKKPFAQWPAELSGPRLAVYALLLAGIFAVGYATLRFGLAGAAVACLPMAACVTIVAVYRPGWAMLGLFTINYFIMALRHWVSFPIGLILDAAILFNFAVLLFRTLYGGVEWSRARNGLTLAALLWLIYCVLELTNPNAAAFGVAMTAIRSYALYFLLIVILTAVSFDRYKYLPALLGLWSVLTLLAVGKACIQKFIGFSPAEINWLFYEGGRTTHLLSTGVRYFSFFSDAANFGSSMGLSMVVLSIASLYYRNPWMRLYMVAVAAAACYGMLISGTRSALAVPFAGYALFIVMSRRVKIILTGAVLLLGVFLFLNYTTIGQGNAVIRRARSAFNLQDKSFVLRMENQAKLRTIMRDKPFGAGLGHGGGKALAYAPEAETSQIPTDSWFVMVWVETGIVGLLLHLAVLCYAIGRGVFLVMYRLRDSRVKGFTAALTAGIFGVAVASYANEIFGQIPNGAMMYVFMALIFLSPRFDRELARTDEAPAAQISGKA